MAINLQQGRRGIRICSINIGGLSERSKLVLDKYVDEEQYDIVTIQETGTVDPSKLSLSNMTAITDSNQAENKGAAMCIQNKHSITKLEEISSNYKHIDSCWGLVVINNSRYIIGNIYVKLGDVNGITNLISMLEKAQQMTGKLKSQGVILTGDMNARHQFWGDSTANEYGRKLLDKIDQSQFTIMTTEAPSFLCTNGSSYIDLVIISNNLVNKIDSLRTDSEVELFSGAPFRGHVPIITTISSNEQQRMPPIKQTSIKGINWNNWSDEVESLVESKSDQITEAKDTGDPYKLLSIVDSIINSSTEKHGTKKILCSHSKPYWTKELTELSKKLRIDRKNYTKRNTDRNKEKLENSKIKFDEARKKACQDFIMKKTNNLNAVESQKFWKEFKKITSGKTTQKVNPLDDGDGGLLTENDEIEQLLFSTFFEGRHLEEASFDEQFYQDTNTLYEDIMKDDGSIDDEETTIELNADITMDEVKSAIKGYKCSGKSFDNHGYQPEMFKHLGMLSLQLILMIFNLCLHMKIWIWDNAEVIFLKKEGKKSYAIPGSYRPISITAYLGKLFEKIMSIRAKKLLQKKNYNDPDQEGFTERKNTIRYLNRLFLGIKSDLQQKKTVICLFLDFEKAFDSVWKKGLIVKLFKLGIKGNFLKLIDHFLASRKVSLNVNGVKGSSRNCSEFGLPQGSVLSPIMFKIFMIDFLEEINDSNTVVYKFADDGTVKISADSTEECLIQLQKVLDAVHRWAAKWRMVINCLPNKTEVMCFGTAESNKELIPKEFKLGDQKIKLVSQTKVLGVILDEDLSFVEQSKDVYKKLTTRWNVICTYCNRNWGFSQKVMCQLIRSLFLSCLFYGSHIWMNRRNMKDINSLLYKILKTTVGAIFNVRQSISEVILGLPPVHIQNQVNQIKHYLKIIINDVPEDQLISTIKDSLASPIQSPVELTTAIKSVYKFLSWKARKKPEQFSEEDTVIINQKDMTKFHLLSRDSCKYTRDLMKKYTESLWNDSLRNEFLCDGHDTIPKASISPLPIPSSSTRKEEVLLMSMFYENNLLNSFLNKINRPEAPSAICHCGLEDQTAYHVVLRCSEVDQEIRSRALDYINLEGGGGETSTVLLNSSRDINFLGCMMQILGVQQDLLRDSIDLN